MELPSHADVLDSVPLFFATASYAGTHLIVAGNSFQSMVEPLNKSHQTLALYVDGARIAPPAGAYRFMEPRILPRTDGSLTMLWAEPSESDRSLDEYRWIQLQPVELLSAFYDGKRWTTPRRVYSGKPNWDRYINDSDPLATKAVAFTTDASAGGVTVIRWEGPQLVATRLPTPSAGGPTITAIGDTVVVAYLAARQDVPADANSVFVIRSTDAGRSWATPRLVATGGNNPARDLRLRRDPRGRLHLIWRTEAPSSVVHHVGSLDQGQTWGEDTKTGVDSRFNNPIAVVNSCGEIAVYYEAYGGSEGSLRTARWSGRWLGDSAVLADYKAVGPAAAINTAGTASLVFIAYPPGDARAARVRTYVARFR
jgi:hypothetical protein